jgi:hypothetical protein
VAGNGATGTKTWFLTDLNNDNGVANHQVGDPNASSPNPDREQKTPDVAFSDTYQAATPFNGTFNGVTYEDLSGQDTIVGVVGFQWCASNNFPAGTRNMTPSLASYLLGSGAIPASFFTGNSGDNNALVYATGRNPDSGTRITTLAETGFGIGNAVNQYKPTITGSGATATVTSLVKYPLETINGVSTGSDGNSGESSGGTVRAYLNAAFNTSAAQTAGTTIGSTTVTAGYFITYLGASDANSTLSIGVKPAVPIAYNGINYWTAPNTYNTAAIGNGSYSFWCYEHVMIRATPGPGVATFATTLSNNILAQPTSSLGGNVALGDMYVQRASDGGQITSLLY